MRRVVTLVLALAMTTSPIAWADPITVSSASPVDSASPALISPLRKGQYAPFSGILFSPRAAASVVTEAQSSRERARIEAAAASASAEARAKYVIEEIVARNEADRKKAEASLASERVRAETAEKAAAEAQAAAPNRTTWMAIGGTVGVVVTLLVVFGVSRASN